MTNLEQAAAAAIAAWERDGARYDTFCVRMDALREALAAHKQAEPVVSTCDCHRCIKEYDLRHYYRQYPVSLTRMILCPTCGNKRCPKASDRRLDCTNSNERGQPGSVYTTRAESVQVERDGSAVCAIEVEREACAQLCAGYTEWSREWGQDSNHTAAEAAANECADAIRARGRQTPAQQAEPVAFTDAAIEAAITAWFGWNNGPTASMMTDVSGFEGRMRAAIKAACDFKEAK